MLRANRGREFRVRKFWVFCKKCDTIIKYAAFYIYKENNLTKKNGILLLL